MRHCLHVFHALSFALILATGIFFGARAQAADTTVFPPQTSGGVQCPSGETMVLSWNNGEASTKCLTGQEVLHLALDCTEGQYVSLIGNDYACKSVPACVSNQFLSFDGTSFQCHDTDLPPTCDANEVLTFNGTNFYCVARTDNIPTCGANQFLTYNGSVYQCVTVNTPAVPNCGQGQVISGNGSNFYCIDVASALPNCGDGQTIVYSGGQAACTTVETGKPVLAKDTGFIVTQGTYDAYIRNGLADAGITPQNDADTYNGFINECINGSQIGGTQDPALLINQVDCQRLICYGYFGDHSQLSLYSVTGGCPINSPSISCAQFSGQPAIRMSCFY